MSKRNNYTTQHIPKKKKEFGLAYLDTSGQYNRLYEATFKGPNDDFNINMSPDDPRLKLQKQREDEEWERFKRRNMKIKVNYFKSEEERRRYLESKEPLPINPHMIVLSKDPKRKIVTQRKRQEILISEVGFSDSEGEDVKAAALLYSWLKIENNPQIIGFIYNDNTGSYGFELKGKSADVFRAMDTANRTEYISQMVQLIPSSEAYVK